MTECPKLRSFWVVGADTQKSRCLTRIGAIFAVLLRLQTCKAFQQENFFWIQNLFSEAELSDYNKRCSRSNAGKMKLSQIDVTTSYNVSATGRIWQPAYIYACFSTQYLVGRLHPGRKRFVCWNQCEMPGVQVGDQ